MRDPIPVYIHLLRVKDLVDREFARELDVSTLAREAHVTTHWTPFFMVDAHLLGWTYSAGAGETTILGPDEPLGWIRTTSGAAEWVAHLRVPDVDAALRSAEAAGATSVGVGGIDGRRARIIDPQGAPLALWQDG